MNKLPCWGGGRHRLGVGVASQLVVVDWLEFQHEDQRASMSLSVLELEPLPLYHHHDALAYICKIKFSYNLQKKQ